MRSRASLVTRSPRQGAASLVNVLSAMQASLTPPNCVTCLRRRCADALSHCLPWPSLGWQDETGGDQQFRVRRQQRARNCRRTTCRQPGTLCPAASPTNATMWRSADLGVVTGDRPDVASFRRRAFGPEAAPTPLDMVELDLRELASRPTNCKCEPGPADSSAGGCRRRHWSASAPARTGRG